MFRNATLNDLDYSNYNVDDDNKNLSDNSYVFNDEEFDVELDNKNKLDNKHDIGNDKVEADYFVNDDDESDLGEDNNEN